MAEKKRYTYIGPIFVFDSQVSPKWSATTWAVSEKQAKSNLLFRAKKAFGYNQGAKLSLDALYIKES